LKESKQVDGTPRAEPDPSPGSLILSLAKHERSLDKLHRQALDDLEEAEAPALKARASRASPLFQSGTEKKRPKRLENSDSNHGKDLAWLTRDNLEGLTAHETGEVLAKLHAEKAQLQKTLVLKRERQQMQVRSEQFQSELQTSRLRERSLEKELQARVKLEKRMGFDPLRPPHAKRDVSRAQRWVILDEEEVEREEAEKLLEKQHEEQAAELRMPEEKLPKKDLSSKASSGNSVIVEPYLAPTAPVSARTAQVSPQPIVTDAAISMIAPVRSAVVSTPQTINAIQPRPGTAVQTSPPAVPSSTLAVTASLASQTEGLKDQISLLKAAVKQQASQLKSVILKEAQGKPEVVHKYLPSNTAESHVASSQGPVQMKTAQPRPGVDLERSEPNSEVLDQSGATQQREPSRAAIHKRVAKANAAPRDISERHKDNMPEKTTTAVRVSNVHKKAQAATKMKSQPLVLETATKVLHSSRSDLRGSKLDSPTERQQPQPKSEVPHQEERNSDSKDMDMAVKDNAMTTYIIWGTVSALSVGLCVAVIYCAMHSDRAQPWSKIPKRGYR
jgi:hypothetical protein